MKKNTILLSCFVFGIFWLATNSLAAAGSVADWTTIFDAEGGVKDLCGGIEAVFLQDNISAGVATDMTVLDRSQGVVYNGPVARSHDLGNGYVYASRDELGHLIISAAAQRFNGSADTYVEFEFNQGVVGVTSGAPWPISGSKTVNDMMVRFVFAAGNLTKIDFGKWNGATYALQSYDVPAQTGCFFVEPSCDFCNGASLLGLQSANTEVWDSSYNIVQVPAADGFVEARIDVNNFLGTNVEFTTIVMKTPQDVVFGSFQAMGYWRGLQGALALQ